MPSAAPRRHWYSVDTIKVVTMIAILAVLLALGGVLVYRARIAALPEIGHAIPLEEGDDDTQTIRITAPTPPTLEKRR